MKNIHLNDYDIQQFAFDPSECKTDIIEHMSSCSLCKNRVDSYLALSKSIKNLPEPKLEFDVSNRVLRQLEATSAKQSILNYFIYFLTTLSIIIAISPLFYFREFFVDLFKSNSAISTSFIISIAFLISLIMTIDMIRSYNKKISMLNY